MLDDGSTDGTADVVRARSPATPAAAAHRRAAAGRLARQAARLPAARRRRRPAATVLVFVDADVSLAPARGRRGRDRAASAGVDLLTPVPPDRRRPVGERLVQPLLQWSWLTFLPLRAMERSPRPSLAAAGGQFLVVDRAGLRPGRRARGGARPGARGHRAGPRGQAGRRPDRARRRLARWPTAACTTSWRRAASTGYTQVAVGVVRLAGRRGRASSAAARLLYVVPPVLRGRRRGRRRRRRRRGRWPATCSAWPAGS